MSDPDWDTYYCKHCARFYGWLPAIKDYIKQTTKESVTYFTLSDVKAVDVFMLEMEGILIRDERNRLPNVVICEGDPSKIAAILDVVRPPVKEAVIPDMLQDLLTFEDDEYTRTVSAEERPRSLKIRKRLRTKQNFEILKKYLPFDIINFDPNDNLLNPAPSENRLYKAFENIFELQKLTDTFLLLVTTPIYDVAPGTDKRLRQDFATNVVKYTQIRGSLLKSVKTVQYDEIDETVRIAHGFAKSIVLSAARLHGWNCAHKGIYVYENEYHNKYLSSAVKCSNPGTTPDEPSYIADITSVVINMPKRYSYGDSLKDDAVRQHLGKIVEFRRKSRQVQP
jgi:hypothetical protein